MKKVMKLRYIFFILFAILIIECIFFSYTFKKINKPPYEKSTITTPSIYSVINKVDIFEDENTLYNEYGGNQMDFKLYLDYLLDNNIINSIIGKYYPNMTYENKRKLLLNLSDFGCGYVAAINSIFENYAYDSKGFKDVFGFKMYNLTIAENGYIYKDFNFQYLILDLYLFNIQNKGLSIEALLSHNYFFGVLELKQIFPLWLKENYNVGVNVQIDFEGSVNNYIDLLQAELKKGNFAVLTLDDFNLYDIYNDTKGNLVYENVNAHAMSIVKVLNDNTLIVSSWGKKYLLELNNEKYISPGMSAIITFKN